MAEDIVLKEQLTEAMIEAGAQLTHELDEAGVPISAALWLFKPEINEWQLVFASPDVATQGSVKVYRRVFSVIGQLGEKAPAVPPVMIRLLEPNAEIFRLLRLVAQTGPGIGRIRMSRNAINGHFIDDALIYRVT